MSNRMLNAVGKIRGLSSTEKFVLICLANCHNEKNGKCCPSIPHISAFCELTERAVYKTLKSLLQKGYVEKSITIGKTTQYEITPEPRSPLNHVQLPLNHVHPTPEPRSVDTILEPEKNRKEPEYTSQKKITDKAKPERRASRFQLDAPPQSWIDFCKNERPELSPSKTFDSFRDYWIAKSGKDATKRDWSATWRNWVRNQRPPPGTYPKPQMRNEPRSNILTV